MSTHDAFSSIFKNYIQKHENIRDFVPDQTIIFNEKYMTHLYPFQCEVENSSLGASRYDQWYPFVNSYYSFTEDVDAYARVNHLVGSHPSMTSSSSLFGPAASPEDGPEILTAPNTERQAHTKYINSKPVCFLILGKPEIGQENLGRRLANYWKCLHIDPQTLLEEEIASGSRAGQCIEFNLRCGRAIGVDVILRLLADKVQSPSARHRGYVISGFPLIPNDLYEEDPISSESAVFNVKDIFEDIIDQTIDALDVSMTGMAQVSLSSRQPSEASMQRTDDKEPVELLEKFTNFNLSLDTSSSLLTEICVPADIASDSERQINCLFGLSWDLFVIIYLACENKDVTDKRNNTYFDIYSKKIIDMQKMELFFEVGATNEHLSMDVLDPAVNPLNENPNLRHLTRQPINLTSQIATQLDRYHTYGQSLIDRQILLHDIQYYIRLDGRAYLTHMLDIIKMRLKILPIQRVLNPERLTLSFENEELGEGRQEPPPPSTETLSLEDTFHRLSRKQIVGPEFKWGLSSWNYLCPVNMKRGNYVKGDPKYAVQFMTKIFFLADYGSYLKFLENPRSFLRAPFPKPSCRMMVFGPPLSGKTTVARALGYMYDGQVFNPKDMSYKYLAEKTNEFREKHRRTAMLEAFKLLESQKKKDYHNKVEERKQQKQEWKTKATEILKELLQFISARSKVSIDQSDMSKLQIDQYSQQLRELNLPASFNKQLISKLLGNENELFQYLPEYLTVPLPEPVLSITDPFVIEYANNKVSEMHVDSIEMTDEYLLEMYVSSILGIQRNKPCNGWIVDDATVDVDMLQQICEHCKVDNVIILQASDDAFLIERSLQQYRYQYSNYKNFFLSIGEVAAAWRCPSPVSTTSYKNQVASEIIRSVIDEGLNEQERRLSLDNTVDAFKQSLINYNESIKNVRSFFENLDCQVYTLDVNGLDSEQLMLQVIQMVQDNYRVTAVEYTDKDRAEDVQDFLASLALDVDEGGERNVGGPAGQDWKETFESQRRYGYTNVYCPVTFFEKSVLWHGKEDCAANFNSKLFLMSSRQDLDRFLAAPRYFTNGGKLSVVLPPPRICIVGVPYSGKTTIAKMVARNLGVRYANYEQYLTNIGRTNEVADGSTGSIINDTLEEHLMESFITHLWFSEPIKSIGFVLDDFPRNPSDVDIMLRTKAIPDYVIWLIVDDEINRGRLLTKKLEEWRLEQEEKRRLETIKNDEILKQWEESKKTRYNQLMDLKRQTRYLSKLEDIAEDEPVPDNDLTASKTQVSFDSVEDQEDIDEVMAILDKELPEPVLFDETEDEQEAIVQFTTVIDDNARISKNLIEQMKTVCLKELIPWTEIDGNLSIEKLAVQAFRVTNDVKFRNESFFEQCFSVSVDIAEKLLSKGYFFLSRFGKTCPVQCCEKEIPIQMYLAAEENNDLYPVIHRQYIYFVCGKKNREKFIKNPLNYIVHSCNFPLVPFRVGVIGPPKCGKTKLATRFSHEYGFKTLSRGHAIRYTLDVLPFSNLAKSVESVLRKGEELPDDLVLECVHAASFHGHAITQGLVFDGFPNTINEVNLLARYGLVPHSILDLRATDDEVLKYSQTIPIKAFPIYSERFTNYQLIRWRKNSEQFRVWCQREYQNIEKVSVSSSIWGVWNSSRNIVLKIFSEIKHYYRHARSDQALSITCMLITPLEFLQRQSPYKNFCPVCLRLSKSLRTGGDPPDRTGLVHFREYFYWVCSEHVHVFMETPEDFTPSKNVPLPDDLPTRVTLTEWPENVHEGGICVVCLNTNRPDKVLSTGNISFAISYLGKIYLFDTEDCLVEFLRDPHLFSHLTITYKNPPEYPSLRYDELPILGYLEQYIAQLLVKAVNHVARRVPVPDERFDYLCEYFKPASKVPAFLNVVDIAGLVKGASQGQGLGNAFLSHISACDAIFHLCRVFEDDDVTHVEGDVDPVRDLDIISEELRLKDEETLTKNLEKLERTVGRGADKKLKPEYDTLVKVKGVLVDEKKHIRFGDWDTKDIEVLNKYLFLTSKPTIYLVNLGEKDYIKKKNRWLAKIKEWVDKNDPGAFVIPFSGAFELKLLEEYSDPALRKKFIEETGAISALDKIIVQGYKTLQLEYFFTAGADEVKAWTIQKGTKAPQAAGRIHTDFEKGFIMAEVMKFVDFKEEGSEAACKAAGKYRQQGRNYTVEDGDIIFFKFNAGAGLKDPKKK